MFKRIQRAEEFSNQIGEIFGTIEKGKARNVTFVVTEQCSLRCTYCYQCNKSSKRMTFDVAKRFIDMLFDTDDGSVLANIIEFIGGEPFLEIDLITKICEYWDYKCVMENHRWGARTIFNFSSNGMNYHEPKVQEFMKKYHKRVSINITIDGDKELHDSCRVTPDGKGSYDIAHSNAELHKSLYGADSMGSKITIAPENLKYLYKAIKHYIINDNAYDINANTVFEEGWTLDHAKLFYQELKKIADFMIDNDYEDRYLSLFQENGFSPMSEKNNKNYCGGNGAMLALGTDGKIFPCIRYMSYSLGENIKELDCGSLDKGIDYKMLKDMEKTITRRSQSTDECYYCPIAQFCAWCFVSGTKIATPSGLKNIENLQVGDIVLDMNGNSQPIIRKTSHIADDLYEVKASGLMKLTTTSEHPFWVKPVVSRPQNVAIYGEPRWVSAKDIHIADKIALFVPDFKNGVSVDLGIAYLVGRYIGDGWKAKSYRKKNPFRYYLCCGYHEEKELESHLINAKINYQKFYQKTIVGFNIGITGEKNKELTQLFDKCGRYAKNKNIPREVWGWDLPSVQKVLEGYFDADGSFDAKAQVQRFASINRELILNVAELVRGIYKKNVNITERIVKSKGYIEGRLINQSNSYEGRFSVINPQKEYYEYDEENNIMWVNAKTSISKENEKQEVFNIEVGNNPTYIAEGALVHNCTAYNYQVFGTPNKRATFICVMHKARSLGNVYYWNRIYKKHNIQDRFKRWLPNDESLKIIDEDELKLLNSLENQFKNSRVINDVEDDSKI